MSSPSRAAEAGSSFRFSTDALPERDRLAIWCEEFGRQVARYEFEPLVHPVRASVSTHTAFGLGLVSALHSSMRIVRTLETVSDGDDALVLQVSMTGSVVSQRGRDIETSRGDAVMGSNAETITIMSPAANAKCVLLMLSRQALRPLLSDFDAALMRRVTAQSPALRLLMNYITVFDDPIVMAPEFGHLAVTHIHELVAYTLGAKRDVAATAGGLRAARLRAAKTFVLSHLADTEMTAASVAAHLGVSPRYVHMLFDHEDENFTEFVLERRLGHAFRMLADARYADLSIGMLALDAGFRDLSHFNRSFRRRFGCTPTDVRQRRGQD